MSGAMVMRIDRTKVKKLVGVQQLLEWAFGCEYARIETDSIARLGGQPVAGVGMEWILMERQALGGVRIDVSRGRSSPHDDAELIAAVVESLPSNVGGLPMALRVAELARAGIVPDWMRGARTRCVPRAWRQNKHGYHAVTEVLGCVTHVHRGRRITREVRWCPITYTPSAQMIAAARRGYLDWWGALLHIQNDLRQFTFRDHELSCAMPPMEPWRRPAEESA